MTVEPPEPPPGATGISPLQRLMRAIGHLMPASADGTNPAAVRMFQRMDALRDVLTAGPIRRTAQRLRGRPAWPITSGAYVIGDPAGPVAICTMTSNDLMQPLATLPGVAIAGRVYVPNLGIEKIIRNVTANPRIRFLLLCGKESPVFHPGQALECLFANGIDTERRIIGAVGHLPVLQNISAARIAAFQHQVELVDATGQTDSAVIAAQVAGLLARNPGPFAAPLATAEDPAPANDAADRRFVPIRPGGQRAPLAYDPKGFFVITLDRAVRQIVLRHYLPDNTPAHEMRGHTAEAMLLGLLREDLVSQMSHAGYLGGELAKAEVALRLGLPYEQDQPLRRAGN
jgi:tetrahydromethanopterin S-methyltransferase subunit A